MHRFLIALVLVCLVAPIARANDAAALDAIAYALIQRGADGVPYGTLYYRALPQAGDGRKLVRIYPKPYARELALVNRSLWYRLVDAQPLSPTMQAWLLEVYRREFPQLQFEITDDPTQANLYTVEARFVPNPHSGKQRPANAYYKTAGNSMNASIHGRLSALIHFNSIGNPWMRTAIDREQGAVIRATMLNEFFNGLAVSDFQDLKPQTLNAEAQTWLTAHHTTIDDYTITRSGGPRDDEHLKPLDRAILQQLFR